MLRLARKCLCLVCPGPSRASKNAARQHTQQGGLAPCHPNLDVAALGVEQQVRVADQQRRLLLAVGRRMIRRSPPLQQHQQRDVVPQAVRAHLQRLAVQAPEQAGPPEGQAAVRAVARAVRVCRLVPAVWRIAHKHLVTK